MSAEVLRRAAALMRERAEAATPGPWKPMVWDSGLSYRELNASVITADLGDIVATADNDGVNDGPHGAEGADAHHIASWHPAVALAVADWLDEYARVWELTENSDADMHVAPIGRHALTVARAYLGESA